MKELIIVKPDKCLGCNSCVRTCPAPEANITKMLDDGRFITTVDPEKCIACGECVRNCIHGARDYIDDTDKIMDSVAGEKEKFIVIVAPAIKSVFPEKWKSILEWFSARGCLVYDVSFGADICTWAHLRAYENKNIGNIISQPCAAIVKYIETYKPSLIKNLSPIHSPMLCAVTYIKKYLRRNERIIALSPCIAKKNEFTETGLVDFNVTFKKLMEYFAKNDILIYPNSNDSYKYAFEGFQGQMGAIYPRIGGLRDNLWLHNPDINITTSEGVHKVYPELDMYAELPEIKKPEVFDVLSCEFGCNVGAGTGTKRTIFDAMETMREVEKEAKSRRKVGGGLFFRGAEDKLFKKFDDELNLKDFLRDYKGGKSSRTPAESDIMEIFKKMGKTTETEQKFDCHACGYRSCRDMAIAIYRGLNVPENCSRAKNILISKQHKELEEITSQIAEMSISLNGDVQGISQNMNDIRSFNQKSIGRTASVKDLMLRLKEYSHQLDDLRAMPEDTATLTLEQFKEAMSAVISAFDGVDEFMKTSNEETTAVDGRLSEIQSIIDDINDALEKTKNQTEG